MYKKNRINQTNLHINESYEGETIENKVNRIVNNREPIKDGAPLIYTDRKDGVKPAYDIRTDRWDIAIDAMDRVTKANIAKREGKPDAKVVDINNNNKGDGTSANTSDNQKTD